MRRIKGVLAGILLGAALLSAGCEGPGGGDKAQLQPGQLAAKVPTIDDLQNADKLYMTTKADTDLPNSWEYAGAEARDKMAKLVTVLRQGKPMEPGWSANKGRPPAVSFIVDLKGNKYGISIFADHFEYGTKWWALDHAPEKTYSVIEELNEPMPK
jgi:hypothetical protein